MQEPIVVSRAEANERIANHLDPKPHGYDFVTNLNRVWWLFDIEVDGMPFRNHREMYRLLGHSGAGNIMYQDADVAAEEIALAFLYAVEGVRYQIEPEHVAIRMNRKPPEIPKLVRD